MKSFYYVYEEDAEFEIFGTDNPEVVERIVQSGIPVDCRTDDGETPLLCAAFDCENPNVVKTLVRLGANVNERAFYTGAPSALYLAIRHNPNPEIARVLIEAGAEVNDADVAVALSETSTAKKEKRKLLLQAGVSRFKLLTVPWIYRLRKLFPKCRRR